MAMKTIGVAIHLMKPRFIINFANFSRWFSTQGARRSWLGWLSLLLVLRGTHAESALEGPLPRASKDIIAPFFQPPAEFAGQFGAYRSPLVFRMAPPSIPPLIGLVAARRYSSNGRI